MSFFFTADLHLGHERIIEYCGRPFNSVEEMDDELINRFNSKVGDNDQNVTVIAGDFAWTKDPEVAQDYTDRLNGRQIFLRGDHDYWMDPIEEDFDHLVYADIWKRRIGKAFITVCHYQMTTWPRSHHNTWQLYGHSHGQSTPAGKQWDVGVDNNDFYPVSFNEIREIMRSRPDNFNLVRRR